MPIAPTFSAKAVVVCVHDREKRKVTELAFDPTKTSLHQCVCCENLFLEPSDVPMFCPECRALPSHSLAAPLAKPIGRV